MLFSHIWAPKVAWIVLGLLYYWFDEIQLPFLPVIVIVAPLAPSTTFVHTPAIASASVANFNFNIHVICTCDVLVVIWHMWVSVGPCGFLFSFSPVVNLCVCRRSENDAVPTKGCGNTETLLPGSSWVSNQSRSKQCIIDELPLPTTSPRMSQAQVASTAVIDTVAPTNFHVVIKSASPYVLPPSLQARSCCD